MPDPPPYRDTGDGPRRGSNTGTPRWVKVLGIIALVLILLIVISLLTGGSGGHGPGRHIPSAAKTPPSSGTESSGVRGHKLPAGRHTP